MKRLILAFALCASSGAALAGGMPLLGAGKSGPGAPPPTSMTSPVLAMGGCNSAIPNTANSWGSPHSGSISGQACWTTSTTISGRSLPMPTTNGGTAANLYVAFGVSAGSYTFGVSKNYTTTPTLKCLLDSVGGTAPVYACSDTAPGDAVSFNLGDAIGIVELPAASSTTANAIPVSFTFTSAPGTQEQPLFWGYLVNGPGPSAIGFYGIGQANFAGSDVSVSLIIPTPGTLDNLFVQQSANSATGAYAYFLYKNGVQQTSQTCAVGVGVSGCSSSGATNTPIHFNAGDTASVEVCPAAAASLDGACPTGAAPTNTVQTKGSIRWVPDIAGEAIVSQRSSTMPPTSGNRYFALNGAGQTADSADGFAYNIAPIGFRVKKFWHAQDAATGTSPTRTLRLRAGLSSISTAPGTSGTQAGQAVTCTLTTSSSLTIGGVSTVACNDLTNVYDVTAGNFVDWETSTSATQSNAVTWFKNSAVVCLTGVGSC